MEPTKQSGGSICDTIALDRVETTQRGETCCMCMSVPRGAGREERTKKSLPTGAERRSFGRGVGGNAM